MKKVHIGEICLEVPIIQGGMGVGISLGNLAGNVALNGGMGVISTAHPGYRAADFEKNPLEANKRELANEIKKAKEIAKGKGMVAINALNSDYVNNTAAVSKIIEAGTSADGNGYLYPDAGQNFMEFFLPLADGLDASMVTAEDQQILSLMDTQTKAYATGEKDLDTALADLTASIHDTFSYLSAE